MISLCHSVNNQSCKSSGLRCNMAQSIQVQGGVTQSIIGSLGQILQLLHKLFLFSQSVLH